MKRVERKGKYVWWLYVLLFLVSGKPSDTLPLQASSPTTEKKGVQPCIRADRLFQKGIQEMENGQYLNAISSFQKSTKHYQAEEDWQAAGDGLIKIGTMYFYQSQYPKALSFYEQSISLYQKALYPRGISFSLNNIGAIHYYLGHYPKALEYYEKARQIQVNLGNTDATASINRNIAGIYIELGNYDSALQYFQEALELYRDKNSTTGVSRILNGIGEIRMKQEKYGLALTFLHKAIEAAKKQNSQQHLLEAYFNLGAVHERRNQDDEAIRYYQTSLSIALEIKSLLYQSKSLIALGGIEGKTGPFSDAIAKCEKGLRIARELKALDVQREGCHCLYTLYKKTNATQKTLSHLEMLSKLEDSLHLKQTTHQMVSLEYENQRLTDSIVQVEKRHKLKEKHQRALQRKEQQRNVVLATGLVILILAVALWSRLAYVRKSKSVLQVEKDRSEQLLLNILPKEIAEELKQKGYVDAQDFDAASILFTDFKSFTETASHLSPKALVQEINTCFKAFDTIIERYGIEKIKTIGDAYMAAGGLPKPDTQAVKKTILAGIEMQEFVAQRKLENDRLGQPAFEMRVGIHVGPIVAGIVGVKKFQYDVWGDTVNMASRMESQGEVGKINISKAVYDLVQKEPDLQFEYRGKLPVKGKSVQDMYFVSGSTT